MVSKEKIANIKFIKDYENEIKKIKQEILNEFDKL
jgi:hypothetical protein